MVKISRAVFPVCLFLIVALGCGQKKEEAQGPAGQGKVQEAVKEAVTKEFKMYEGAKQSIKEIEKQAQKREEKEQEVK